MRLLFYQGLAIRVRRTEEGEYFAAVGMKKLKGVYKNSNYAVKAAKQFIDEHGLKRR
jgi:hypothetical protein